MNQFILTLEIDNEVWNSEHEELPLHCTLMHWFLIDAPADALVKDICSVIQRNKPVPLESCKRELFGLNCDVPVHTVRPTTDLMTFHHNVYRQLQALNATFPYPQWVGEGYRPHVSDVGSRTFAPGSRHISENVILYQLVNDRPQTGKRLKHAACMFKL